MFQVLSLLLTSVASPNNMRKLSSVFITVSKDTNQPQVNAPDHLQSVNHLEH